MSKLLYNTQPLVVDPELAAMLGLNEAIVLQQVHYWCEGNRKADRNFEEGYWWTYNSYLGWMEQFPFWSFNTIRRAIASLEERGLLVSGNFNKLKIDRTKWYRIDYEMLERIGSECDLPNISGNGRPKMGKPFAQNGQMDNHAGLGDVFYSDVDVARVLGGQKKRGFRKAGKIKNHN